MQNTSKPPMNDLPANYQIIVNGQLDSNWAEWFGGLTITVTKSESGVTFTTLTGQVADQGALHGLLTRLRDFGLTLLEVHCRETGSDSCQSNK